MSPVTLSNRGDRHVRSKLVRHKIVRHRRWVGDAPNKSADAWAVSNIARRQDMEGISSRDSALRWGRPTVRSGIEFTQQVALKRGGQVGDHTVAGAGGEGFERDDVPRDGEADDLRHDQVCAVVGVVGAEPFGDGL